MPECIASYHQKVDGWDWSYELLSDRLVARGHKPGYQQHFEFELKHCADYVDRGVHTFFEQTPVRMMAINAAVVIATILLMVVLRFVLTALGVQWIERVNLYPYAVIFIVIEFLVVTVSFIRRTRVQRSVTFKRVSDGGALLVLHSSPDSTYDDFDEFIARVLDAVRSQRQPDLPFQQAIRRA